MSEITNPAPIPAPVETNKVVVTGLDIAAAVTINEITVSDSNIFYSDGTDIYWNGRIKIGTTTGVLYNSSIGNRLASSVKLTETSLNTKTQSLYTKDYGDANLTEQLAVRKAVLTDNMTSSLSDFDRITSDDKTSLISSIVGTITR
tara:strand:- start:9277 stop:9714 length:438 start_codon:yes stop_codon:yes gene_type:complete